MELEKVKEIDLRTETELEAAFYQANITLHKDYLTMLADDSQAKICAVPNDIADFDFGEYSRFYRLKNICYNKEENNLEKLATVFNAEYYSDGTLILLIQKNKTDISYYIGVVDKNIDDEVYAETHGKLLKNSFEGNFVGSKLKPVTIDEVEELFTEMFEITEDNRYCISAISGVATDKIEDEFENNKFIQGMEKLLDSTAGHSYSLLILADPVNKQSISSQRLAYEAIYTQLSPYEKSEWTLNNTESETDTLGSNESYSVAKNEGETDTIGITESTTTTKTDGTNTTTGWNNTTTSNISTSESETLNELGHRLKQLGDEKKAKKSSGEKEGIIKSAFNAVKSAKTVIGGVINITGKSYSKTSASSESTTVGTSGSNTITMSTSAGETTGTSESHAKTIGSTDTVTTGVNESTAIGLSKGISLQISSENRSVKSLLDKIDLQLERMEQCENFGTFNCAAYVISNSTETNNIVASMYNALMRGEESNAETSHVNTWHEESDIRLLSQYLSKGYHPQFQLLDVFQPDMIVTPASVVSGRELALHMSLPKKSVPGLPVIERVEFGRGVYTGLNNVMNYVAKLGNIYHMGQIENTLVQVDVQSLASHTFITGSTGTGKSNAVYQLLGELERNSVNFLIIEPAKGEYKHMFGMREDVYVYGTNPYYTPLLKINPFKFPKSIHVLEHVDRLVEIFNVCWPMYAAMPAVLKDSILRAYESCGWDMITSKNVEGEFYPTFADVLRELDYVINNSAYSADTKGDYIGSLATRLNSLTNGLNGQVFVNDEIDNTILFDSKTIIDLSRVGSMETKSLLMGILVMRLSEHRMVNADSMNQPLKHVTVLEEAHNILKRTSTEQNMENANLIGKSVEMISNAIAEMRTYGEGFIIADQSPNAVDISAIRNTNTKIIMRLPDESDRQLAGRAAALKDEQLPEIAKLPKGVAVVYQNDWLEPVLCKINKYAGEEVRYVHADTNIGNISVQEKQFKAELLKLLLKGRVNEHIDVNVDNLHEILKIVNLPTKDKIFIRKLLNEYSETGKLELWEDYRFESLAACVSDILACKQEVAKQVQLSQTFELFNPALERIVRERYADASQEMCLAMEQCLLRSLVTEQPENLPIYAAWREISIQGVR